MGDLEILCSTYKSRLFQNKSLLDLLKTTKHIIVDQFPETKGVGYKVLPMACKGLTKSRNNAIENATGDICLIGDDDIKYVDGFKEKIIRAFRSIPNADVITFKAVTPQGRPRKKTYKKNHHRHNIRTILSASSVEICFKLSSIKKENIRFDENFGLNSRYPKGEEAIFLRDCIKSNMNVYYCPEVICEHPVESSGKKWDNMNTVYASGAVFKNIFGMASYPICLMFFLKNIRQISDKKRALSFLLKGAFSYAH